MAVKTQAQVQSLVQAFNAVRTDTRTWLDGTFRTNFQAAMDAIDAGDWQPEDKKQRDAIKTMIEAGESLFAAVDNVYRSIHPTLGRYSGSTNLDDLDTNVSAFHDKLIDDSESVESRDLTKFSSWSAGGSNVGNGEARVLNTDAQGTAMDISHVETLTLRCTRDSSDEGIEPGQEEWTLYGGAKADESWLAGGSSHSGSYGPTQLTGTSSPINGLAWDHPVWNVGETRKGVCGASDDNLIRSGDFEGTFSSNVPPDFTLDSGTPDADTSVYVKGAQSLYAAANFKITQKFETTGVAVPSLRGYTLSAYARVASTVTAGSLTVKILDDSTTHATITFTEAGLTNDTWTRGTEVDFILPAAVGANLRCEVELASYAGSGNWNVDEVVLAPMYLNDRGRLINVVSGATHFRKGDLFTGATTSTDNGETQTHLNETCQRWVEHAGTPVGGWTD